MSKIANLMMAVLVGLFLANPGVAQNADENRERVNQGTVAVLGGSITGTYSQLVWDMSSLFDNGYDLRVLPVLGKGSLRATEDLLYLKGIDVALVQSDVLDFIIQHNVYPNIQDVVRYITVLFNEEVHLVARSGINTIEDLRGKKVSFGPSSSGTFMTASVVFDKLGIEVEALDLSHQEGLQSLREGKIDAMVRVAGAPVRFLQEVSWEDQLHIVPIPLIEGAYVKSTVDSEQYPGLVPAGDSVDTIAAVALMAAYNWPAGHPRRAKVQRMVNALYERLPELQVDPYHPKWKQVDLEKQLPGWTRWQDLPGVPRS